MVRAGFERSLTGTPEEHVFILGCREPFVFTNIQ